MTGVLEAYRRDLPYSYAPGLFPSLEALTKQPQSVRRILLSSNTAESGTLSRIREICASLDIRIEQADRLLSRISGKENCFAAAVFEKQRGELRNSCRHLVLYRPSDRGNLGCVLRSALGFSFLDVALVKPCADPFDPHVVRACMGALFSLRVEEFDSIEAYLLAYPGRAVFPFMLTGSEALDVAVTRLAPPYSLLLGNEGSGLPGECAALGRSIRIRHGEGIDSLNLSVAAGIGMYAFSLQEERLGLKR